MKKRSFSAFTIGLAFFSMFFGSGNLVFPLFLGSFAGSHWVYVALGFILGGVLGPFLGTLTMVLFKGDTNRFFYTLPPSIALGFMTLLTAVWIPLGAGPRCIQVAYEAFLFFLPNTPFWMFSTLYSVVVVLIIMRMTRVIETLGYFLTPALLTLLGALFFIGIQGSSVPTVSNVSKWTCIYGGIVYGYSTMDLIASFFFSSSLIYILRHFETDEKKTLKKAFFAGSIGMGTLAIVYLALVFLSAKNADILANVPKEQILTFVSKKFLGETLSIIPVLAIILACLTTSIAMTTVYAEFIGEKFLKEEDPPSLKSSTISAALSFGLSFLGLSNILKITWPVLQVSCPLLIILAIYNIIRNRKNLFLG